jgi:hypothetical protein
VRTLRRPSLRLTRDGALVLPMRNSNHFKVAVDATLRSVGRTRGRQITLGRTDLSIPAGARRVASLRLSRANRRLLAHRHAIYSYLTVLVSNARGEKRSDEWTFTLRPARGTR